MAQSNGGAAGYGVMEAIALVVLVALVWLAAVAEFPRYGGKHAVSEPASTPRGAP